MTARKHRFQKKYWQGSSCDKTVYSTLNDNDYIIFLRIRAT